MGLGDKWGHGAGTWGEFRGQVGTRGWDMGSFYPNPLLAHPNFTHLRTLTHLRTHEQNVHSLARPDHLSFMFPWGRVGWGGVITFMFPCTRTANLIIFLAVLQAQALHCSFMISYRWGGVGWGVVGRCGVGWGWGNNVHVPVHTHAQQPHHFSCCPADTGTALLFHGQLPVGWGAVRWGGAQQPHHFSCCPADTGTALLFHDQLPVGWGGVGGNNVHVPAHTQENGQNVPATLQHLL